MKKSSFWIALVFGASFLLFSPLGAYPQGDKEVISKKEAQAEVVADSSQYVIGPEDVLNIHVWKEGDLSRTVPVRIDGKISLPLVGEIVAAGLTPLQLKEILIQRFKEFVDIPNVSVMVMEANSFKVFVSGQVRGPGVIRLRSETSLLQLIPMLGGFTEWANQRKILIIRNESGKEKRYTVNYKRIVEGKDPNFVLKSGDIIIVP